MLFFWPSKIHTYHFLCNNCMCRFETIKIFCSLIGRKIWFQSFWFERKILRFVASFVGCSSESMQMRYCLFVLQVLKECWLLEKRGTLISGSSVMGYLKHWILKGSVKFHVTGLLAGLYFKTYFVRQHVTTFK
jgi:hypothetical protein